MPIDAVLISVTTWGLAAASLLATREAARVLHRPLLETQRLILLTAAVTLVWVLFSGFLAASGSLSNFEKFPPPFLVFIFCCAVLTMCVAFSGFGKFWAKGLSFSILIGFQVFRVLAELMLYVAFLSGHAPLQMTWDGMNYDILTGLTALPVAWWVRRTGSRNVILAWNVVGLLLLVNIVVVSILSSPTPLRVFMNEPANTFVSRFPYVWLPAVLVQSALLGHLLCFRKLWLTHKGGR